jgi:AraC family transcriptional regulator
MRERTRSFYNEAVREAAQSIAERLDHALDLEALARSAELSPLHFHRVFRGVLGETPLALHRRLRLERAALELAVSDTAVTAIAFDAGFETHESFTRAFQAAYALAPSQFRKRMAAHRERMGFSERFPFELASRNGIHIRPTQGVTEVVPRAGETVMDIAVVDLGGLRLAAVTHLGPRNMIGEAFGRLAAIAGPSGLFGKPGAAAVAVFHGDAETTPAAELRSDAGVIVSDDCAIPSGLAVLSIPPGTFACVTHHGHYAGLSDAWDRLRGQWLPNSGRRLRDGAMFEVYRVADHSQPDSLETDLYLPVE